MARSSCMRHADLNPAFTPSTAPTASTRPTAGIGGGSGFGAQFGSVQEEVAAFIQNGSSGSFGAGSAALKTSARFRAYPDQASAFRDYAQMLIDNPRFRGVLKAGSDAHAFASALAKGGYATDPAYAAKLSRLAGKLQGISG